MNDDLYDARFASTEAVMAAKMLPALAEDHDISWCTNVHKVQEALREEPSQSIHPRINVLHNKSNWGCFMVVDPHILTDNWVHMKICIILSP